MALNNVRKQAIKVGKVVALEMNQLVGNPILYVEHLGETNFGFVNDSFAQAGSKAIRGGGNSSPEGVRRAREANRETVARHSVRKLGDGWFYDDENGNPDAGRPVPSSPTGIAEVVDSLPDEVFDSLLIFVINAENFRDTPITTSAGELAKK